MLVLLADGQAINDSEIRQRDAAGLPRLPILAVHDGDFWLHALTEKEIASTLPAIQGAHEDYKWVSTAAGPIRIKDRAAQALKQSGFKVTLNNNKGKHWEKTDKGLVHQVQVDPKGRWLHQSVRQADLLNGLASPKGMARGDDHKSLSRHMSQSDDFIFSSSV